MRKYRFISLYFCKKIILRIFHTSDLRGQCVAPFEDQIAEDPQLGARVLGAGWPGMRGVQAVGNGGASRGALGGAVAAGEVFYGR